MTHAYHEWPEEKGEPPVLYDDCAECKARAERPWDLDADHFERAWKLMVAVEHGDVATTHYRTHNERRLCGNLYLVAVQMERFMGIEPWQWPPVSMLALLGEENAARLSELLGRGEFVRGVPPYDAPVDDETEEER